MRRHSNNSQCQAPANTKQSSHLRIKIATIGAKTVLTSMTKATTKPFAQPLIAWQKQHGRHTLPWQSSKTPYRVWISEIMLQQTQVTTVIPFYERFMQSFPNIADLAKASTDAVLSHWSGLGYYARARNLHATAKLVVDQHKSGLPDTLEGLVALPGIGRSTAGAILSLGMGINAVILDGNVKRVLTRYAGISEWPSSTSAQKELWALAEKLTPRENTAIYNQAMMDLGSMICSRSKPQCHSCPIQPNCYSNQHNLTAQIPAKKPKKERPKKARQFLIMQNQKNEILLEKRPTKGIWGGLWSLPERNIEAKEDAATFYQNYSFKPEKQTELPCFEHQFSHYTLVLHPVLIQGRSRASKNQPHKWHRMSASMPGGIAKPIQNLLESLNNIGE